MTSTKRASTMEDFEPHRTMCFSIAYRMLGSSADAEDLVQEASLRFARAHDLDNPGAWLRTVVTRLAIDQLESARARREVYVGPWLPEPVLTPDEPVDAESLSIAFMLLLERLSAPERAAFLLHRVFELDYAEVAASLDKSEAAVRQLVHRARERIAADRPRFAADRDQHARLLMTFLIAVQSGDLHGVQALLAEDARAYSDGGGQTRAARNVVFGRASTAKLFVGLVRKSPRRHWAVRMVGINGAPSIVCVEGRVVRMVLSVETDGDVIHAVHWVLNPDKLRGVARSLGLEVEADLPA